MTVRKSRLKKTLKKPEKGIDKEGKKWYNKQAVARKSETGTAS